MTQRVNYDIVAPVYDKRYETHRFDGLETVLRCFIEPACADAAEVGCGTGHWLAQLTGRVRNIVGLDLSAQMLQRARTAAPSAFLVRGRAEKLPWATGTFDRVFCVNAVHHFDGADAFIMEARRVLRPGGAILIVGLDPHTHLDQWWIYDYFPATLGADRARYLSTATIRGLLTAVGFVGPTTAVAQHIHTRIPFAVARDRGQIKRSATSQLMVIADNEYQEGLQRLGAEQPILETDLRLYATSARTPPARGA